LCKPNLDKGRREYRCKWPERILTHGVENYLKINWIVFERTNLTGKIKPSTHNFITNFNLLKTILRAYSDVA